MSARRGGVYVIRTRKPGAVWGLPIIGRHTGYVGLTSSFHHRRRQHLEGDSYHQVGAKCWADLQPRFYPLIPLPNIRFLLEVVESLLIAALCPVYNVRKQPPWNVRKIRPSTARRQRSSRDTFGVAYRATRTAAHLLLLAALVAAGVYVWHLR